MRNKKILVTGNLGYVGSAVVPFLQERYGVDNVAGLDAGWFAHDVASMKMGPRLQAQLIGDLRTIDDGQLELFLLRERVDVVVHLAAVSNDPVGNRFSRVTRDINELESVRLARIARRAGAEKFVFASSCSVYGAGGSEPRSERSPLAPQTAYARSKIAAEWALMDEDCDEFRVIPLRFATACGPSDRIRLDIVLNDFVATALVTGRIDVLSDGSPWRPLINVSDMATAIAWAVEYDGESLGPVNVGFNKMNFQIRELAEEVARQTGASLSVNSTAAPDTRSYRVDFSLYERLNPAASGRKYLAISVAELVSWFRELNFPQADFKKSRFGMRLNALEEMIAQNTMSTDLRWRDWRKKRDD